MRLISRLDELSLDRINTMKHLIIASILVFTLTACRNGKEASNTARSFAEKLDSLFAEAPDFSGIALVYETHIARYLDSGATIILLCNNQHEKFDQLLRGIEDLLAKERS